MLFHEARCSASSASLAELAHHNAEKRAGRKTAHYVSRSVALVSNETRYEVLKALAIRHVMLLS
jgi:hypothetical protein